MGGGAATPAPGLTPSRSPRAAPACSSSTLARLLALFSVLLLAPAAVGARHMWMRFRARASRKLRPLSERASALGASGGCPLAAPLPELAVFFHFFQAESEDSWRPLFEDTLRVLFMSSLLRRGGCGGTLHLSSPQGVNSSAWGEHFDGFAAAGVKVEDAWHGAPFPPELATPDVGERPTLGKLHDYCTAHPRALVLYLHDKGVRYSGDTNMATKQLDWRRMHEHYLVEVWEDCVRHLWGAGAGASPFWFCGAELMRWHSDGSMFYAGNFWWGRCDIVRDLVHPMDASLKTHHGHHPERYWSELWLMQAAVRNLNMRPEDATQRAFNCAPYVGDHYYVRVPRARYEGRRCEENHAMYK